MRVQDDRSATSRRSERKEAGPRAVFAVLALSLLVVAVSGCREFGLIIYDPEHCMNGYTLIPGGDASGEAILFDMEGNVVQTWSANGYPPKLLPGGSLITNSQWRDPVMLNEGVTMAQLTWDGATEWSFSDWVYDPDLGQMSARQHHDFQRQGNPVGYYAPGQDFVPQGTTLVLSHLNYERPEISPRLLLDDVIYEVDWAGNIVFTWQGADHYEEYGFDADALEAIERIGGDWIHVNTVSWVGDNRWYEEYGDSRFHPDNIIFCSRHAGFIAIIDRLSGDVVWRVGPDYSEGQPEADLEPIIGQHHAHVIPKGLPGEGNILLFDNGGGSGYTMRDGVAVWKYMRTYSRVIEFDPITLQIVWDYDPTHGDLDLPYSTMTSGAQRLPNGNTLITSAMDGLMIEVTPENRIVWEYRNPNYSGLSNLVYRAYRIPPEWLPAGVNPGGYPTWESLGLRLGSDTN